MNRILLTSLALLTLVNYNNNSVATESIGNMDITGTVNLNEKDAYDIIGTCNVSGNGVLNATKPVSITNDSDTKAGSLKIDGETSNAAFIGGLIVDGGELKNTSNSNQLTIVDNLTLVGAPTVDANAQMYASDPTSNNTVTIKVSGLTGQINNFEIEPVKNPNADSSIDSPIIYLNYNSSELDLDTATTDKINENKTTIQNTLTSLFKSSDGYLVNCDLSNVCIKDYLYAEPDISDPEDTDVTGNYVIPLSGNTLLDTTIRGYIATNLTTEKQPTIFDVPAPTEIESSSVLSTFFADPTKNVADNTLTSWPDVVMPLTPATGGNTSTEIKLSLTSSEAPLKLSGGGTGTKVKFSGNNSGLANGVKLYGDKLVEVEFDFGDSITPIDYSNVTTNAVSMKFSDGTNENTKNFSLSAMPTMNENQKLSMSIGSYSTLTLDGDKTYNVSTLTMPANSKLVVNAGTTLNA